MIDPALRRIGAAAPQMADRFVPPLTRFDLKFSAQPLNDTADGLASRDALAGSDRPVHTPEITNG